MCLPSESSRLLFSGILTQNTGSTTYTMKLVMGKVEYFAWLEDVWFDSRWMAATVTQLWSTI